MCPKFSGLNFFKGGKSMGDRVSRRQFLNYTLTGVGGFMAAGMLMPMVRFAVDPILEKEAGQDLVAVAQVKTLQKSRNVSILKSSKWMRGINQKSQDRLGCTKLIKVKSSRCHQFVSI